MTLWFLILLELVTFFVLQRSVTKITKTPVWLLWLVLMAPALLWTVWIVIYGEKQPPQTLVLWVLTLIVICPSLFWLLLQWGFRVPRDRLAQTQIPEPQTVINPTVEPAKVRLLEPAEEIKLRDCFPWSVYYVQKVEYRPRSVICWGQLRNQSTEETYQQIKAKIDKEFGDRFLLRFLEGHNGKPYFELVLNTPPVAQQANAQVGSNWFNQLRLPLLLLLVTLVTTTLVGVKIAGFAPTTPEFVLKGLPYGLGLITILGIHELGHYLMATKRYKIRSTLPYFIPMPDPFLGTLGAFIQMRSPVPNRKALFDVGIAGPIAGFIVTLPLLIWGLAHSDVVPLTEKTKLLDFDALNPKFSILLGLLAKLALGSQLTSKSAIDLHPLAVAGFLGLIITALNLMPVGQLDGGHIIHAMFGQKTAEAVGQITRLLVLILSFTIHSEFSLWAIILLFMPLSDEPALNDVTELDNRRDILGLLAMALLVVIVLPLPQAIANLLQI